MLLEAPYIRSSHLDHCCFYTKSCRTWGLRKIHFLFIEMETMVLEEVTLKPQLSHIALWPKPPKPQRESPVPPPWVFPWTHANFSSLVWYNWSINIRATSIDLLENQKWQGLGLDFRAQSILGQEIGLSSIPSTKHVLVEYTSRMVSNSKKLLSHPPACGLKCLGNKNSIFSYYQCWCLAIWMKALRGGTWWFGQLGKRTAHQCGKRT